MSTEGLGEVSISGGPSSMADVSSAIGVKISGTLLGKLTSSATASASESASDCRILEKSQNKVENAPIHFAFCGPCALFRRHP